MSAAALLASITTPSCGQAAYLRACVDSVLDQNYGVIDYSVADGGSTDGSVDMLRGYGKTLKWRSAVDAGEAAAINAGSKAARGEIVGCFHFRAACPICSIATKFHRATCSIASTHDFLGVSIATSSCQQSVFSKQIRQDTIAR